MIRRGTRLMGAGLILVVFLTLMAAPVRSWAADIKVEIKPRVEVAGDKILLGDLAVITGPDCALKDDLADVFITKAPVPGRESTIRRTYLEHRIRTSGLPLDMVDWELIDQVVVTRKCQTLSENWVREVFEDYLAHTEPYKSGDWNLVSIKTGAIPKLPVGDLDFRISQFNSYNSSRLVLEIFLMVNAEEAGRIRATGQIDIQGQVVVTTRRIENDHQFGPVDLKKIKMPLSQIPNGALIDPTQAVGMSSRRRLDIGQPVLKHDLVPVNLVHKGDLVTIVAESGPLRVTTTGKVIRDAALGENVVVLNLSSKKTIQAKVTGPDTVEVLF